MFTKKVCCLAAVVWTMGWGAASADDLSTPPGQKPGVFEAMSGSLTATVQEINYETRMVTLKREDGTTTSMVVGPEATRFSEIKKGDIVKIDYLESVAIEVRAPSETFESGVGSNSAVIRNKGKKPSGMAVQTDVVTATVVKINAKKRTATLRGPEGNLFDIDIAPDVKNVENVKKGDQLLVKHTRTMALNITKPEKK